MQYQEWSENMEEKEMTLQEMIDLELENLWEELKTVSLDQNGRLKTKWYAYSKGTARESIYSWFDYHHSKGIAYLMKERKSE